MQEMHNYNQLYYKALIEESCKQSIDYYNAHYPEDPVPNETLHTLIETLKHIDDNLISSQSTNVQPLFTQDFEDVQHIIKSAASVAISSSKANKHDQTKIKAAIESHVRASIEKINISEQIAKGTLTTLHKTIRTELDRLSAVGPWERFKSFFTGKLAKQAQDMNIFLYTLQKLREPESDGYTNKQKLNIILGAAQETEDKASSKELKQAMSKIINSNYHPTNAFKEFIAPELNKSTNETSAKINPFSHNIYKLRIFNPTLKIPHSEIKQVEKFWETKVNITSKAPKPCDNTEKTSTKKSATDKEEIESASSEKREPPLKSALKKPKSVRFQDESSLGSQKGEAPINENKDGHPPVTRKVPFK